MIQYVHETTECRSKLIGSYFGDHELNDCGICDNCLRQRSIHLSKEEFDFSLKLFNKNNMKNTDMDAGYSKLPKGPEQELNQWIEKRMIFSKLV